MGFPQGPELLLLRLLGRRHGVLLSSQLLRSPLTPTRPVSSLHRISHDLSRTHCTSLAPSHHARTQPHRISLCTSIFRPLARLVSVSVQLSSTLILFSPAFPVTLDACYVHRARARRTHPRPRLPTVLRLLLTTICGDGPWASARARRASAGRILGLGAPHIACMSHVTVCIQ